MARKDDAPAISLFSFQDIITSLTGIMFLIVLLLILFMLEMSPKKELQAARQERRAIAATRAEIEAMQQQMTSLRKSEKELSSRIEVLQKEDLDTLREKITRVQHERDAIRSKEASLQEAIRQCKKRTEEAAAHTAQLERQNRELARSAEEEEKRLDALRKSVQNSRVQAEQLKHVVRYTVENASTLAPVLVECNRNGISLLECATGQRVDLPCPEGTSAARQQLFLDYLSQRNTQGEYYTILVKPETFDDAVLVEHLKAKGIARGLEFLPSDDLTIFRGK